VQVEITVKVGGRVVRRLVEEVGGTLEQMEETVDELGRRVACDTLQASVDGSTAPRPLFRQTAASCDTKDTGSAASSD